MRFKNFQIGKNKEKPESDADEENDAMVNQIADMEEHVNGKTKELEETEQQLKELSDTVQKPKEETPPRPHGPIGELTVEPGDVESEEIDTSALFEGDEEGAPVVEVVKAEPAADGVEKETPVNVKEVSQEAPPEAADDSLSNLFSEDEEEENPLTALIASMPDVTPQELLDDLNEIHQIIKDWQH